MPKSKSAEPKIVLDLNPTTVNLSLFIEAIPMLFRMVENINDAVREETKFQGSILHWMFLFNDLESESNVFCTVACLREDGSIIFEVSFHRFLYLEYFRLPQKYEWREGVHLSSVISSLSHGGYFDEMGRWCPLLSK